MTCRQEPSPWILRFLPFGRAGRRSALDLAAGSGRHSQLLLNHGLAVTAINRDPNQQADAPGLTKIATDLETDAAGRSARRRFDLVVVTNYLHRPILPTIVSAVAPAGVVIYETFALGNERFGKPSNPDFLLRPGELKAAVGAPLRLSPMTSGAGRAAPGGSAADRRQPQSKI